MRRRAQCGVLIFFALFWLVACSQDPKTGPGEVHWDRDGCEHCQMTISDRRFAVQVRTAHDHKLHRFDDLGCALLFLDGLRAHKTELAAKSDPELYAEFWVRNPQGTQWQDAHGVAFHDSYTTPMGYGYAPAGGSTQESLATPQNWTLSQVWERVRVKENERRRH